MEGGREGGRELFREMSTNAKIKLEKIANVPLRRCPLQSSSSAGTGSTSSSLCSRKIDQIYGP